MLDEQKISDYVAIVKGRILEREEQYKEIKAKFDSLPYEEKLAFVCKEEQLKRYKKFVNDFEKKILTFRDEYGPVQ